MVAPDSAMLLHALALQKQRISKTMQNIILSLKQHLVWVDKHLSQQHPKRLLIEKIQYIDLQQQQLHYLMQSKLQQKKKWRLLTQPVN